MIRQNLYIPQYDWLVHCYYAVDTYYTEEIIAQLSRIGCPEPDLQRAYDNLNSGKLNHGLCYSNARTGVSVMVVGLTSSAAQCLNSITHEVRHLTNQICNAYRIDPQSEESCYLSGDVSQMIYLRVRKLLCDHCRCEQK